MTSEYWDDDVRQYETEELDGMWGVAFKRSNDGRLSDAAREDARRDARRIERERERRIKSRR